MPGNPEARTRKNGRREEILDAAVELFARHGYRGTGLLALADKVGMRHSGILSHFGTKEGLLLAVMERRRRLLDELVDTYRGTGLAGLTSIGPIAEPEVLTRLAAVLRAENLSPGDPLHGYFRSETRDTRAVIAGELRAGQDRGEIRADVDPDVKATEIVAFAIGIETQWLLDPEQVDRDRVHDSFVRTLLDDLLVTPEGR